MPATVARNAGTKVACDGSPTRQRRPAWPLLPPGAEIREAGEGDHYSIFEFLRATLQSPGEDGFAAQLERPGYEPSDRLLLMQEKQVLSHLLVNRVDLAFGEGVELPAVELVDFHSHADLHGSDAELTLIDTALRRASAQGRVLATMRTTSAARHQARGWCLGPQHSWSSACPRDLLSLLSTKTAPASLQVRIWRQIEQDAIDRLHAGDCRQRYGLVRRDDEHWRWLVSRGVCDRVYVAVESGPPCATSPTPSTAEPEDGIVGYAFVRRGRIAELCVAPGQDEAAQELLRRVCYDAIESDEFEVRLDGPADLPLHDLFVQAGGDHFRVDAERDWVNLLRIVSIEGFLAALTPLFETRAAKLDRPCELGLAISTAAGVQKLRIVLAKRSVQIATGKVGRSYLAGGEEEIQSLLVGRLPLREALSSGKLQASTQTAAELAATLFPALPLYRSPLDDLPDGRA
ncbi:MAG: hypothetical protein KDB14_09575 [Planctomycetales bacterium]|nr:hypothetical protein [Planctomycetales bacterium]